MHSLEMQIKAQDQIIDAQKTSNKQISLLEGQNKELLEAGNMLSKQCKELENIPALILSLHGDRESMIGLGIEEAAALMIPDDTLAKSAPSMDPTKSGLPNRPAALVPCYLI